MTSVPTLDGTVSTNKVEISNNQYVGNFAGGGEGLLDFRGFRMVYLYNESFINNGENVNDTYTLLQNYSASATQLFYGLDLSQSPFDSYYLNLSVNIS